jgi:hypothetical protein
MPDCLTPPNGAPAFETMPWFSPTMPVSRPSQTRIALLMSRVNTYATRPYSVSFARAIASSSDSKEPTGATGPKISSWNTRASEGTSPSTVGA